MRLAKEEWARDHEECPSPLVNERRKSRVDLPFRSGSEYQKSLSQGASRRLGLTGLRLCSSNARVYEQAKKVGIGQQLPH